MARGVLAEVDEGALHELAVQWPEGLTGVADVHVDLARLGQRRQGEGDLVEQRGHRGRVRVRLQATMFDPLDVQQRLHHAGQALMGGPCLIHRATLPGGHRVQRDERQAPAQHRQRVVQVVYQVTHPRPILRQQIQRAGGVVADRPAKRGAYLPFQQPGHHGFSEQPVHAGFEERVARRPVVRRAQGHHGHVRQRRGLAQPPAPTRATRRTGGNIQDDDVRPPSGREQVGAVHVGRLVHGETVAFEQDAQQQAVIRLVFDNQGVGGARGHVSLFGIPHVGVERRGDDC